MVASPVSFYVGVPRCGNRLGRRFDAGGAAEVVRVGLGDAERSVAVVAGVTGDVSALAVIVVVAALCLAASEAGTAGVLFRVAGEVEDHGLYAPVGNRGNWVTADPCRTAAS